MPLHGFLVACTYGGYDFPAKGREKRKEARGRKGLKVDYSPTVILKFHRQVDVFLREKRRGERRERRRKRRNNTRSKTDLGRIALINALNSV